MLFCFDGTYASIFKNTKWISFVGIGKAMKLSLCLTLTGHASATDTYGSPHEKAEDTLGNINIMLPWITKGILKYRKTKKNVYSEGKLNTITILNTG